jgi:hypothetical protein
MRPGKVVEVAPWPLPACRHRAMRDRAEAALIWWLQRVQGVRNPLDGRGFVRAIADENGVTGAVWLEAGGTPRFLTVGAFFSYALSDSAS